jgi:hypothetical protein
MRGGVVGRVRAGRSRRSVRLLLIVVVGVVAAVAFIFPHLPRPITGVATIDQCHGGWVSLIVSEADWDALPNDVRTFAGTPDLPIAAWPDGMRFDETAGVLLDAGGNIVFRKGDRVRITGKVVETNGDPAPCFYLRGLRVESIAAP